MMNSSNLHNTNFCHPLPGISGQRSPYFFSPEKPRQCTTFAQKYLLIAHKAANLLKFRIDHCKRETQHASCCQLQWFKPAMDPNGASPDLHRINTGRIWLIFLKSLQHGKICTEQKFRQISCIINCIFTSSIKGDTIRKRVHFIYCTSLGEINNLTEE